MEWTINRIEDLSEELHDLVQELEDRYGDLKEALFFALKDGEITKEAAEDMDKKIKRLYMVICTLNEARCDLIDIF